MTIETETALLFSGSKYSVLNNLVTNVKICNISFQESSFVSLCACFFHLPVLCVCLIDSFPAVLKGSLVKVNEEPI